MAGVKAIAVPGKKMARKKKSARLFPDNRPNPLQEFFAMAFPAIAQWVQDGHIEIGDQEGFGFVVRSLDYGGMVFEDDKAKTLLDGLIALEKGLTAWFKEQGIKVE